jgi:hypothetical protein
VQVRFTNASGDPSGDRLAHPVWDDLERLESRRRQLQLEHELAVRRLDEAKPKETRDLRAAWRDYCEVIAELDDTIAALQHLRADTD